MEEKIVDLVAYDGKLFPEGAEKANWGAYWHNWNRIRFMLKQAQDKGTMLDSPYQYGHLISARRHHEMLDGYIPRFRRQMMSGPICIGKGGNGKVFKTKFGERTELVAVKVLEKGCSSDHWKERDLLIFLKHKRIVNLVGAFYQTSMFLVMELCFCALNTKSRDLSEVNRTRFTIQAVEAVDWIHSKNVVHGDLKLDNFLITTSNNLVLSDFGNSLLLENDTDTIRCKDILGVSFNQDAEANLHFLYNKSSDIFSLGCMLFEMWCGTSLLLYKHANFGKEREREPERERQEYARAVVEGRIVGIKDYTYPYENAKRRKLADIVAIGNNTVTELIQQMIKPREDRIKIAGVMESGVMKYLRQSLQQRNVKLDTGGDPIGTCETLINDVFEPLKHPPHSTLEQNAAYLGIYFDEDEMLKQGLPIPAKSLLSYDNHVVANFIKSSGLERVLIDGLASGDATELAEVRKRVFWGLTEGLMGRQQPYPEEVAGGDQQSEGESLEASGSHLEQENDRVSRPVGSSKDTIVPTVDQSQQPVSALLAPPTPSTPAAETSDVQLDLDGSMKAPFTQHTVIETDSSQDVTVVPETQEPTVGASVGQPSDTTAASDGAVAYPSQPKPTVSFVPIGNTMAAAGLPTFRPPLPPPPPRHPRPPLLRQPPVSTLMSSMAPISRPPPAGVVVPQWPGKPLLPPYAGGVVPDPVMTMCFFEPARTRIGAQGSSVKAPVKQQPLSAAPKNFTMKGDGDGIHPFTALNQGNLFRGGLAKPTSRPLPSVPTGLARQGPPKKDAETLRDPLKSSTSLASKSIRTGGSSSTPGGGSGVEKAEKERDKKSHGSSSSSSLSRKRHEKKRDKESKSKKDVSDEDAKKKKSSSSKERTGGDKEDKKRKKSSDDHTHASRKKKAKTDRKSSSEDNDGENDDEGIPGYICFFCEEPFEDRDECKLHMKTCKVKLARKEEKRRNKK